MRKYIVTVILIIFAIQTLQAQKVLRFDVRSKKADVIYLNLNTGDNRNDLEYFISQSDLDNKKNVTTKDNSINIYLEWINPLRYKLRWKDSILTDERDKAINEFISLLVAQFGSSVSDLNVPSPAMTKTPGATDSTEITGLDLADKDLLLLLIHLRANQKFLSKSEIFNLNLMFRKIKDLDGLNSFDVTSSATNIYTNLYNYKKIENFKNHFDSREKADFEIIENKFKQIEEKRKEVSENLKTITMEDKMLKSYTNSVLTAFLDKTLSNLNSNKKIATKLGSILNIVESSTNNESSNTSTKGYYKIRNVDFENGKQLETTLTITEYEFKKETSEFLKKSDILNKKIVFQKYEVFDVFVSTGVFYSNTTLKSFGVSNNGSNSFTIVEDNINKNVAVTALFLNLGLNTSRYFSPLLQIGIDPTKKTPFLLLGGGFSISAAKIAFSAGPIWTWNQRLDKLQVGQTITSTTDLDKNIKYEFDVAPKGLYLGIQHNF